MYKTPNSIKLLKIMANIHKAKLITIEINISEFNLMVKPNELRQSFCDITKAAIITLIGGFYFGGIVVFYIFSFIVYCFYVEKVVAI